MTKGPPDILVTDLTVVFSTPGHTVKALDHVSLSVERGKMCCIVGPSGCGKSTLLRAILGLTKWTGGSVELNAERVREGIAFVQQDSPLLPWRTALQNACLGPEIRGELNKVIVERVRRQLGEFDLAGFEESLTSELSGGMRQRVAIARALESRPALLFCDEPFSAVDFVGRLALTSKFKYLCRIRGITTIFVTHNIEEAIFLGDEVVVMTGRPGRIKWRRHPNLSVGSEDAVKCRKAPEFTELFQSIWQVLRSNHD
jgi:ABC-type nitrate/sulfonate/bicarbonate transport system ATPase subunit